MRKKALVYASVASIIQQFNMDNIRILLEQGYQVDVACNMEDGSTISDETVEAMLRELEGMGCRVFHIPVPRSPSAVGAFVVSLCQTQRRMNAEGYALVHCHSPIGGVICRLANRLSRYYGRTRMIYTAHGFHFYKGAPLKNWLLYYPAERLCARWTNVLIAINKEDYERAKRKMPVKEIIYVPGIGVDVERFSAEKGNREQLCDRLNIPVDSTLLLSVGELNQNKNQMTVVQALSALPENVHYLVCGHGPWAEKLRAVARQNGCEQRLHLLGYCANVQEILMSCDLFVFPSFREGLSVALMEAMAAGKAVACSHIRGNTDLIDGGGGVMFDPHSVGECAAALGKLLAADAQTMGDYNVRKVRDFSQTRVHAQMWEIYRNAGK